MYTRARDMIILLISMHQYTYIYPCRAALDDIIKSMKDNNIVDNIHALYGEIGNNINIQSCRPANLLETYNTAGPVNKVQSLFAGRPFRDAPCSSAKPKQEPLSPVIPLSMYSPFTPPESKTAITIPPSRGGTRSKKKVKDKKTIKRR